MAASRIDDLRRRVEADPASIAFAQLAEEYRRAGQTEEAVRVCREGLTRHPGYLSARVTLGRALLDLGQLDDARLELQFVASEAPENLAAVRGLAEIFHREGDAAAALEHFQRALALARHDPELEEIVQQLSRQVGAEASPSVGLTFEEAHQELLTAADRLPPVTPGEPPPESAAEPGTATAPFDFDTLVAALGTPTASPLIEAVVRGETPPVFELPDMPELGADPFAALEAELRGQVETDPAEVPTELALPIEGMVIDPADDVVAATVVESVAEEIAPDPVADPMAVPDAEPMPETETASADEPELVWPVAAEVEEVAAVADQAEVDEVEVVGADDVAAEVTDAVAEVTEVIGEDAVVPPEAPPAADDPEPEPTPVADRAEPMSLVARPEREGYDTMADQAEPTAAVTEAPEGDTPAATPAPGAAKDDGVLDDLEDWLNSLQDRPKP